MYDFSDPLIRDMVQSCHVPTERVVTGTGGAIIDVICEKCHQMWPCDPISMWRTWQANNPVAPGETVG